MLDRLVIYDQSQLPSPVGQQNGLQQSPTRVVLGDARIEDHSGLRVADDAQGIGRTSFGFSHTDQRGKKSNKHRVL